MSKRILALLLALVMVLGLLTACGSVPAERSVEEELQLVEPAAPSAEAPEPAQPEDTSEPAAESIETLEPSAAPTQEPASPEEPEEFENGMPMGEDAPEDAEELPANLGDAPEALEEPEDLEEPEAVSAAVTEDGEYTTPEDVAAYIHQFGKLPSNFITKNKARDLGWDNSKGNLWDVAPGKSIGGDRFGNYEGLLPENTKYRECDVNYSGGYRGAERIIYGEDGSVYYTDDHYNSFTQLY